VNFNDTEFFARTIQNEIIKKNWFQYEATVAVIIQWWLYNPNLEIIAEKTLVIEFIESGGFINVEH
jgi:hypothetical protein